MLRKIVKKVKYKLGIGSNPNAYKLIHDDMEAPFLPIFEAARPFTMTTIERMYALYKSVEYVVKHNIPGDFVECGVWRGGSAIVIAKTLQHFGVTNRKIYLYDTYEGMSPPTDKDVSYSGATADKMLEEEDKNSSYSVWCYADLNDVQTNLFATNYPKENLIFVKGMVENTIPNTTPTDIAILRLDTDWYESTYHELVHLFPLLVSKGVLVIDDYGHWKGSKDATDNYFNETNQVILLNRVDYTCRIGIKI